MPESQPASEYHLILPLVIGREPIDTELWPAVRSQILLQWKRITPKELDRAGPDRRRIAQLVRRKYGIESDTVEIYLRNFEYTMPRMAM